MTTPRRSIPLSNRRGGALVPAHYFQQGRALSLAPIKHVLGRLAAEGGVHDGLDGVHAVLGLVEDLGGLGLEHLVLHFHLGDAEALGDVSTDGGVGVVEGRQAVQEYGRGLAMAMTSLVTRNFSRCLMRSAHTSSGSPMDTHTSV